MSLAGIWAIEVASIYGWESRGILIFNSAKEHIIGGGRNHYSIGTYDLSGDDVKITLDFHFYGQPLVLFGSQEKNISVVLEGKHKDGKITGTVANPTVARYTIPFRLTRRADLPSGPAKK